MFRRRKKGKAREDEVAILVAGPSSCSSGEAAANANNNNKRRYKLFGGKKGHANSSAFSANSDDAREPSLPIISSVSALGLELEHSPMQLEKKSVNDSTSASAITDGLDNNKNTSLTSSAGTARIYNADRENNGAINVQQPPSDTSDADRLSGRTPSQRDSTSGQQKLDIPPATASGAVENGGFNDGGAAAILQRTGWSNVSAASSAANSEQYIEKLDNLPATNSFTATNGRTTKVRKSKSVYDDVQGRLFAPAYVHIYILIRRPPFQTHSRMRE